MEIPSINYINTTQSALNLVDLPLDTLTLICEHLNMREACNLYRTGSKNLREAIANTRFDFYNDTYDRTTSYITQHIPSNVSVRKFRSVFTNAIGIQIWNPLKLTNEDFDYMVPKDCYGRPLQNVRIKLTSCSEWNRVWLAEHKTRKPKYHKNAFTKLEGIHTLDISYNPLVRYGHLKSLKDIKILSMSECKQIPESVLQHFTKVVYLDIKGCIQMTNKALTYLKSNNLEYLNVAGCYEITVPALREFYSEYKINCYEPDSLDDWWDE